VREGLKINLPATLTISLIGFPESTPATFTTNFVYRECLPDKFVAPFVEDQKLIVGDKRRELDIEFPQAPCNFT